VRDDLFKHMAVSFIIASLLCIPFQFSNSKPLLIGEATVTLGIGLGKEIHDNRNGGTGWDWADLGYDALGVGLAVGLHYLTGELWKNR